MSRIWNMEKLDDISPEVLQKVYRNASAPRVRRVSSMKKASLLFASAAIMAASFTTFSASSTPTASLAFPRAAIDRTTDDAVPPPLEKEFGARFTEQWSQATEAELLDKIALAAAERRDSSTQEVLLDVAEANQRESIKSQPSLNRSKISQIVRNRRSA